MTGSATSAAAAIRAFFMRFFPSFRNLRALAELGVSNSSGNIHFGPSKVQGGGHFRGGPVSLVQHSPNCIRTAMSGPIGRPRCSAMAGHAARRGNRDLQAQNAAENAV